MPDRFTLEEGDTGIPLTVRLKDAHGYVDLTGVPVVLKIATFGKPNEPILSLSCDVHPDQSANGGHRGECTHSWLPGEVAPPNGMNRAEGLYQAKWDTGTISFPRASIGRDYLLIEVT